MINTIFWFADSKSQYDQELATQGISDKTIVFIKDTGEIYLNNKKYGNTLQDILNDPDMEEVFQDSALKQQVQEIINALEKKHDTDINTVNSKYDDLEGKHNLDIQRLEALINANKTSSDEGDAELDGKIDNTKNDLNTRIDNVISATQQSVSDSEERLNSSVTDLNNLITTNKSIADNAIASLQSSYNTLSGSVSRDIQDALKDSNGKTIWNRIDTTDGNIAALTNRVDVSINEDGTIKDTNVLQGLIRTYSKTYDDSGLSAAIAEIGTKWALLDANEKILKWLASGFSTETINDYDSFASMYAAGGGGDPDDPHEPDEPYVPEGYAELKALVQEINGAYLAKSALSSLSRADLSTAFAGIATEAYADGVEERAVTTITNKINNKEISAISGLYIAVQNAADTADDAKNDAEDAQNDANDAKTKAEKALAQSALFASMNDNYNPDDESTWGISSATINWANFDKAVSEVITQYKPNDSDSFSATAIKSISTVNEAGQSLDAIVKDAVDAKFANTSFATTSQFETVQDTANTAKSTADDANTTANEANTTANEAITATAKLLTAVGELDPVTNEIKKDQDGNPILLSSSSILSEARSAKDEAEGNSSKLEILSTAYNFDLTDSTEDKKTTWITNAGLLTSANVDTAVAELFASNSSSDTKSAVEANIIATVNDGSSSISLSADKINFTGSSNFEGAVNALDITASDLVVEHDGNRSAVFSRDGSWVLGNNDVVWDNRRVFPLTLSQDFLKAFRLALIEGRNIESMDADAVSGDDVQVSMPGTNIPPSITVQGLERQLAKTDGSKIYYYDQSTGATEDSPQYPYWDGATVAEKREWLQNAASGYKLTFVAGFLQRKQNIDLYTNKLINQLSAQQIDSRVDRIYKLTDQEVATYFGKDSSNYKGDRFTTNSSVPLMQVDECFADVSNPTDGDWGIVGFGADPIESAYTPYQYNSGHWNAALIAISLTGDGFHLYRHTNP